LTIGWCRNVANSVPVGLDKKLRERTDIRVVTLTFLFIGFDAHPKGLIAEREETNPEHEVNCERENLNDCKDDHLNQEAKLFIDPDEELNFDESFKNKNELKHDHHEVLDVKMIITEELVVVKEHEKQKEEELSEVEGIPRIS